MADLVARARDLAHRAHAGQVDKTGRPYIEHVARVAAAVSDDPEAEAVAWLHDVAEDQPEYYARIAELMPIPILVAVHLLDRNVAGDYYGRIAANPLALRVKLADIADNADESRLALLDEKTADRLRRKYANARKLLGAANAPEVGEG
jgi:hypothetical protein